VWSKSPQFLPAEGSFVGLPTDITFPKDYFDGGAWSRRRCFQDISSSSKSTFLDISIPETSLETLLVSPDYYFTPLLHCNNTTKEGTVLCKKTATRQQAKLDTKLQSRKASDSQV
jgi:hypothetical protein